MTDQKAQPQDKEFRHLVRIANTDLDGNKPLYMAMQKIRGVSFMYANAICELAGIDKNTKTGYLSDSQAEKLDDAIRNPVKYGMPMWLFNRRNDPDTGEDFHVITGDLKFSQENDIKRMQMIRCYKGLRHAFKLPVRGQRTRSNFRKNKGKVTGVKRKTTMSEAKADQKKGAAEKKEKGKSAAKTAPKPEKK